MFKHFLVRLADTPLTEAVTQHTLTFARVFAAQGTLLWVLEDLAANTLHQRGDQVSITLEHLPLTWIYD